MMLSIFFHVLMAIRISSSGKSLLKSFTQYFWGWVRCLSFVTCRSFLCILCNNPMSDECFVHTFSQSLAEWCVWWAQVLNLWSPIYPIFSFVYCFLCPKESLYGVKTMTTPNVDEHMELLKLSYVAGGGKCDRTILGKKFLQFL